MKPIMLLLTFFFLFFVVICDVEQAKKPKNIGFKYSERTKIDCGFVGINQKKCEEKGCYFKISLVENLMMRTILNPKVSIN